MALRGCRSPQEQLRKLRTQETEAKHSFEMLSQSLQAHVLSLSVFKASKRQDQVSFAQQDLSKVQKIQAEQSRIKAEAQKELLQPLYAAYMLAFLTKKQPC